MSSELSEPKPGSSSGSAGKIAEAPGNCPTFPLGDAAVETMKNTIIMSAIVEKLPPRNLLILRQTCDFWGCKFLPKLMGEHIPIDLYIVPDDPSEHELGMEMNKVRFLVDFTKAMKSSTTIPFGGYTLHNLGLGPPEDVQVFFSEFGSMITRLELKLGSVSGATIETVRQIVFEWSPELKELTLGADTAAAVPSASDLVISETQSQTQPLKNEISKLRKLTLNGCRFSGFYRPYFDLCKDIFECAVQLEHLSLRDRNSDDHLLEWRARPLLNDRLARLKHLQVYKVTGEHFRLLIELGSRRGNRLQLEEFSMTSVCSVDEIQGGSDDEMINLIRYFLATQSNTLRTLDINIGAWCLDTKRRGGRERYVGLLPRLENLRSLALQRNIRWQLSVQPEDGNLPESWASSFPGLKRVEFILDDSYEGNPWRRSNIQPPSLDQFAHQGVTTLKINMDKVIFADTALSAFGISNWPSVTKLALQLPTKPANAFVKIFSAFCTLWPGLISLRVELISSTITVDLDEVLTGVPSTDFVRLGNQIESMPSVDPDRLRALQTEFKKNPAISDLKQLQEFVLDSRYNEFNITDIGGYLGLAMLSSPTVQRVALIHNERVQKGQNSFVTKNRAECKGNQISPACRSFMRSVLGPYAVLDL